MATAGADCATRNSGRRKQRQLGRASDNALLFGIDARALAVPLNLQNAASGCYAGACACDPHGRAVAVSKIAPCCTERFRLQLVPEALVDGRGFEGALQMHGVEGSKMLSLDSDGGVRIVPQAARSGAEAVRLRLLRGGLSRVAIEEAGASNGGRPRASLGVRGRASHLLGTDSARRRPHRTHAWRVTLPHGASCVFLSLAGEAIEAVSGSKDGLRPARGASKDAACFQIHHHGDDVYSLTARSGQRTLYVDDGMELRAGSR